MESLAKRACQLTDDERERPDEARARALVERVMDVSLEQADKTVGVDHLSRDGIVALEVTRFTDAEKRRGRAAARSDQYFDGMIVTGAPIERLKFEDVDYWPEMTQILDWSREHVHSAIHICWVAQAALYHLS